jgi:hypothetical protein
MNSSGDTPPILNLYVLRESMMAFKSAGMRIAALFAVQLLCWGTSYSQSPANASFGNEISKQESIYQSKGEQVPEGYSIDRSLEDYTRGLSLEFDRVLANLGPNDRWLDIGAGQGQAILNYYAPNYDATHREGQERRGKKAKSVAVSIEDRRTSAWHQTVANLDVNQIQYLYGRRLSEYPSEDLGKFRLISDLLGGFSYTENLSRFMEKVLGLLEVNGSFYTILQDVHSENGTNHPFYPNARFLTEIASTDGSELKVCSWLKRISCVEVTCEFKTNWKPPVESYRIHKVCNDVTVPALVTVHFEAGTPPERRFQIENSRVPSAVLDQASVTP